ncbi:hypothetical protein [Thiorhodospira sibirica]
MGLLVHVQGLIDQFPRGLQAQPKQQDVVAVHLASSEQKLRLH